MQEVQLAQQLVYRALRCANALIRWPAKGCSSLRAQLHGTAGDDRRRRGHYEIRSCSCGPRCGDRGALLRRFGARTDRGGARGSGGRTRIDDVHAFARRTRASRACFASYQPRLVRSIGSTAATAAHRRITLDDPEIRTIVLTGSGITAALRTGDGSRARR